MFRHIQKQVYKGIRRLYHYYKYYRFARDCKKRGTVIRSAQIRPRHYGMLSIGDNICLGDPYLDTHERITIGNEVLFGWGVKILTGSHHYTSFGVERHTNVNHKPVVIEEGAWLGSYSIILPGSHVGKHAVVAAGSVVHGEVEPYTVVGGNPAKFIKEIPH